MFYRYIDIELQLCLLNREKSAALYNLTNKNRAWLRPWLPWLDAIQKPSDTDYFISSCLKRFATGEQMTCGILYKNELSGVAGFNKYNYKTGTAYIGYWLSEDICGRGIMTRTVEELEKIAFFEMNLIKVEIHCAVENQNSRKIPIHLGYKEEGTIRKAENLYGRMVDHVIYGILKEEYLNRNKH
jgi:ribosomal-protein-serine acetyltransferase